MSDNQIKNTNKINNGLLLQILLKKYIAFTLFILNILKESDIIVGIGSSCY